MGRWLTTACPDCGQPKAPRSKRCLADLRALLAEPSKWQGVDRHGAWVASTEDGEHVYLRPVVLGLLDRIEALADEVRGLRAELPDVLAAARAEVIAEIRAGVEGLSRWGVGEPFVMVSSVLALLPPTEPKT